MIKKQYTIVAIIILLLTFFTMSAHAQSLQYSLTAVAWHPHGSQLAVGGDGGGKYGIWLLNQQGEIIQQFDVSGETLGLGWSQDGSQLAARVSNSPEGAGADIHILNPSTGQSTIIDETDETVCDDKIYWSPVASQIASPKQSVIDIWDSQTSQSINTLRVPYTGTDCVVDMAWNRDGSRIYAALEGGRIIRWDVMTGKEEVIYTYPFFIRSFALHPDETQFVLNDNEGAVVIIEIASQGVLHSFSFSENKDLRLPDVLFWSQDGIEIIGITYDGIIYVWSTLTKQLADTQYNTVHQTGSIRSASVSPLGGQMAIAWWNSTNIPVLSQVTSYNQPMLDNAVQIIVPAPSPEKLQAITQACGVQPGVQQSLTTQITTNRLQDFTTQVSALTDAQIPPGCKADLLAVANALMAKGH